MACIMFFTTFWGTTSIFVVCAEAASDKVVIAMPWEPEKMDPTSARMGPYVIPIADNIFNRLIDATPDGEPTPGIATWEVLEGGKVFEFTLRKGIKFHNGDPLTTKDIEFSHNRAMEKVMGYKLRMRKFDKLEIIDDYKIRFIFKGPEVTFLPSRELLIASKNYYDSVGEEQFVKNPIGTGPYRFVEWKLGQYLDIEANKDYWGGEPAIKHARFVFAAEPSTRVSMLKAGEVDMIDHTPYEMVEDLKSSGFKTIKGAASPTIGLQFHTFNPDVPWYDKRVRQAMAYAIDKEAIVKDLFNGIPELYAWLGPDEIGYDPEIKPYPYDPEKAKKLLREAGYAKGFEMPLFYFSSTVGVKETTEVVISYLNQVGIKAKAEGREAPVLIAGMRDWHTDTTAKVVIMSGPSIANGADPTSALDMFFFSKSPMGICGTPELDALIEEAGTKINSTERGEVIKQAFRIINEDMPIIPIWTTVIVYTMKPNINFIPQKKSPYNPIHIKDMSIN